MSTLVRPAGLGPAGRARRRMPVGPRVLATLVGSVLIVVVACSAPEDDPAPPTPPSHVHGIGTNPADGQLYVATHNGLLALVDGQFDKVGDASHDLMGFAVVGDDHFLASGHPGDLEAPNPMGLIESRDAGRTWQTISRESVSDFHAIKTVGTTAYTYDSTSARLEVSTDGGRSFSTFDDSTLIDFSVDDAGNILTTTPDGVVRLRDPEGTDLLGPENPFMTYVDATGDGWAGLDDHSHIRILENGTWTRAGRLPGVPAAFTVETDRWWAATSEGVFESDDEGKSWSPVQ